jgi:hypothetical protein
VLGVVLLGDTPLDVAQLKRGQLQALALDAGDDLTDQATTDAVRLDQDQGALAHDRSSQAPSDRSRSPCV